MLADISRGEPSARPPHPVSNGSRASTSAETGTMPGASRHGRGRAGSGPEEAYFGHSREEVSRILIQALHDLGHHEAAAMVEEDSGYQVESPDVVAFRQAVLSGSWVKAEEVLCGKTGDGRGGLVLAPGADRDTMRFRLRQQKFLELLEQRETARALAVLRNELTPLCQQQHQALHLLSRFLMCQDADDLRTKANWDGANGQSRRVLLSQLSESISPSVMLPDHRLATLLDDVKRSQMDRCLYHTSPDAPSLCVDHSCPRSRFPSRIMAEFSTPNTGSGRMADEVWHVRFSPDGKRLASCGSEDFACVWDVERLTLITQLHGHMRRDIGSLAWSPDSKHLVTCGWDHTARVWNTDTGECIRILGDFNTPVSSSVWTSDGQTIITGSFDKKMSICEWNLRGERLHTWKAPYRTEDLALSSDERWLVAMDDQKHIHVYSFPTREHLYDYEFNARLTSLTISRDNNFLLVNKADGEAVLMDLETRRVMQRYAGHRGGQYTIRSDVGGANENVVVSGSEDGRICFWHRSTGLLIQDLEGHSDSCNVVAWSPVDPCMLASGGDDGRIRIWSNAERVRAATAAAPAASSSRHTNGTSNRNSMGLGKSVSAG
ncbi:hypothetical protein VTJ83DRAFT_3496 [Remersonia thermophila]|uniref:CTLH domain-containing protein n=1 Tax=Remersonia thermophila TaxID=72144 RepID=A0ABR4DES7_9PEZI